MGRGRRAEKVTAVKQRVTAPSEDPASVVARSGRLCIFAALEECCPSSIRNPASAKGRRGLTMIEFNKSLERAGFRKMRDRRIDAATRQEDPTGGEGDEAAEACRNIDALLLAGLCLFSFRQWKNPDNESKKWDLFKSWEYLVETFPHFGAECNWEKFLSVCKRYEEEWKPYSGAGRKMVKVVVADRKSSNKNKPKNSTNQTNPAILRPLQWHSLPMNAWIENMSGIASRVVPHESAVATSLGPGAATFSMYQLHDPIDLKSAKNEEKSTSSMLELLAAAGAALGTISAKIDQHQVIRPEPQHATFVRSNSDDSKQSDSLQSRTSWPVDVSIKTSQGISPKQAVEGKSHPASLPTTRSLISIAQSLATKTNDAKKIKEHMEETKGIRVSDLLAHDGGSLPTKRERQEQVMLAATPVYVDKICKDKDQAEDKPPQKAIKLPCAPHNKSQSGLDPLLHLWEQANIVGL
eukprot:764048-Hanusia_phi.AAC.1